MSIVEKCVDKLEPYVKDFLTSMILERKSLKSGVYGDCHKLIYEIYWCVCVCVFFFGNHSQPHISTSSNHSFRVVDVTGVVVVCVVARVFGVYTYSTYFENVLGSSFGMVLQTNQIKV
jgi:hypothetical protein